MRDGAGTTYPNGEARRTGNAPEPYPTSEDFARHLDEQDELAPFRDRFYHRPGVIYMDGNSLGLLSRDAEASLLNALREWKELGIRGWTEGNPPWFYLGEELGRRQAAIMGAAPEEMVAASSTTINLHQLLSTFYQPGTKILADELNFPSDLYAMQSHLALRGMSPSDLVLVRSRDGRTLLQDDIVAAMDGNAAATIAGPAYPGATSGAAPKASAAACGRPGATSLVILPSVLYRSGQLLDMERLTREAHARGILIGFDCCHSAGSIPHRLDECDVDFAFWCTYKYLNSGPGGIASLYVNKRHFGRAPGLAGWWGYRKDRQFNMDPGFVPAESAGAWQVSSVPVLSAAPLLGSLSLMEEAGIDRLRAKSLALTSYLMCLVDEVLSGPPYRFSVGTPRDPNRRGGHVAVEHEDAWRISQALIGRGVIPDFRPPNVIRLAPIALYTSFHDAWMVVQHLKAIVDSGEHEKVARERQGVT